MSRHRLAAAGIGLVLCFMAPFGANADGRCARGEGEFCLGTTGNTGNAPSTRAARASSEAHWAAGSRMRLGGAPASGRYTIEPDAADAAPFDLGRVSLEAATMLARPYPRTTYGASFQSLDPAPAIHGSYPLSESFSLDLTAGRGRIGLRTVAPDPGYVAGTGFGFPSGPALDRTTWAVALNASRQIGAFGIGGRIGYVDVRDQPELLFDAGGSTLRLGTERPTSLRKSFLGIDASYEFGRNWQMHGGAMYRRDEGRSSASLLTGLGALQTAGDEKEWGVGVRYYGWRNFKLNIEYLKTSGRDQFGNESLLFMGRFDF